MIVLKALEWAFSAFLVVFVVWQIAWPLLNGQRPFTTVKSTKRGKSDAE